MATHFHKVKMSSEEISDKLEKLAEFARTLDFAVKSSYSVDYEDNLIAEVHIDIVPVEYYDRKG